MEILSSCAIFLIDNLFFIPGANILFCFGTYHNKTYVQVIIAPKKNASFIGLKFVAVSFRPIKEALSFVKNQLTGSGSDGCAGSKTATATRESAQP